MQQRDTDRVLRLFERLDYHGKEEGSGIGLNIFKMLVEELGARCGPNQHLLLPVA
ncbi:hypothetical protein HF324_02115 [Chitinophaga oryzae]|uniref:Histidine kinase/HSP90-like ATPase domain-containing protein n=2 Tax=Chitinophaga oryzae TaxID=2725414 RepID=A0AAE7D540_9BACT|nr:hypothetical protein [Chitinophaga oryzae]QJB30208.1 hypothetical protein HF329_02360 [Chitinophaga oryzae]QJB36714.1 hypothetical protein HF324_02115 [Chitinophaga oryzae]